MQDSDDGNHLVLDPIKDKVLADRMTEIPFSNVVTIPAYADILRDQMKRPIKT